MKRSVVTYVHHAVVLLLLLCSLAACSHAKPGTTDEVDAATKRARETLARTLQRYSFAGQHDSVILVARPAYGDAARRHDTLMMVYTGLNMAQSYLFMGDMDSVRRYVDLIEPLKDFPLSSGLHIMRSNVLGSYLLRSSLDYSKALNNYIEGLEWADGRENTSDRIALLSNIVNIFYVQNSDKGYEYAREAYSLATTQEGVSLYAKCAACIVMAQMYYVKHDYDAAERYLTQADRYAQQGGAHSDGKLIHLDAEELGGKKVVFLAKQTDNNGAAFNASGMEIYRSGNLETADFRYNVSSMAPGVYFAKVETAQGSAVLRFIVL